MMVYEVARSVEVAAVDFLDVFFMVSLYVMKNVILLILVVFLYIL